MLVSMIGSDVNLTSVRIHSMQAKTTELNCVYRDLDAVLKNLMCFSTFIATPSPKSELSKAQCAYVPDTAEVEKAIDDYATDLTCFILPIGYFHMARAQARHVELLCNDLLRSPFFCYISNVDVFNDWLVYLNRISDLLFAIAVYTATIFDQTPVPWNHAVTEVKEAEE
jgi:cob(I)alamin adenosyltransferase